MNEKEIISIINLLDDPDESIFYSVREKLLEQGTKIVSQLEKAWENSNDEKVQYRIESIIQTIHFEDIKQNLKKWIEKGAFLLTEPVEHLPSTDSDATFKLLNERPIPKSRRK